MVKADFLDEAHDLFDDLKVNVVTSHRLLGGVVGESSECLQYVKGRVEDWSFMVERLSVIAKDQPQAAYAAFTRAVQNKWLYLQRVVPDCASLFLVLEHKIASDLLPSIFGCEISPAERNIFSLPTRLGGLNIINPSESCDHSHSLSRRSADVIVNSLKLHTDFDPVAHSNTLSLVHSDQLTQRGIIQDKIFKVNIQELGNLQRRAIHRARDAKISSWLNVLPVAKHHFDLSSSEFRDALALRYKKPLLHIPLNCDGCGSPFDLSHALSCRNGGLVIQRHNEIRDTLGDLAALAWGQVHREPIVREADSNSPALIADLAIRGVWTPQTEALFDIRVTDTDAQSYVQRSPSDVLASAEREKRVKYGQACEDRRALFTPLCVSVDGMLGREATKFVQHLADQLSYKWNYNYSSLINWVRTRLSFAVIRATILCLRGSRTKWRSVHMFDGSPLNLIMNNNL